MRPIGASGLVMALALVGAACSSTESDVAATGASDPASAPTEEVGSSTSSTSGAAPPAETADEETPEAEGPTVPVDHVFPDLDTVNIADGSTVNLADQLAGGDTPVLLWFWAPH